MRQLDALAEPHWRSERELPVVQHDYMFMKDVAASDGLRVLSMCVKSYGYGMSIELAVGFFRILLQLEHCGLSGMRAFLYSFCASLLCV